MSSHVYLMNLCHKDKWLQHFLYALQLKDLQRFCCPNPFFCLKMGLYCETFAGAEDAQLPTVKYWYLFEYTGLLLYREIVIFMAIFKEKPM